MPSICVNYLDWIKITISILTLGSIVIAFFAYRTNSRKILEDRIRERDKEYVAQMLKSWQWALDALSENGKPSPPKPDRLNWLTAARHVLRAQKIGAQIANPTYKLIAAENEEFWRHKFYVALSDPSLRQASYYSQSENPSWPENIDTRSALVIVNFSNWKADAIDPIDEVDADQLIGESGTKGGGAGRGVKAYLELLKEARVKLDAKK